MFRKRKWTNHSKNASKWAKFGKMQLLCFSSEYESQKPMQALLTWAVFCNHGNKHTIIAQQLFRFRFKCRILLSRRNNSENYSDLSCGCFRKVLQITAIIILFLIRVWATNTNASTAHMSGSLQPWRQARKNQAIRLLQSRDEDVQKMKMNESFLKYVKVS